MISQSPSFFVHSKVSRVCLIVFITDLLCFSQVWSNDICGCRCASSIVDDCSQSDMGIDVDCKCVDVQAFRDHKSGNVTYHQRKKHTKSYKYPIFPCIKFCYPILVWYILKRAKRYCLRTVLVRSKVFF